MVDGALEEDIEIYTKPGNGRGKQDKTDNEYEVITSEKITELMNDIIDEVISVINLPKTIARILLSHFKWDKQKLMENTMTAIGKNYSTKLGLSILLIQINQKNQKILLMTVPSVKIVVQRLRRLT